MSTTTRAPLAGTARSWPTDATILDVLSDRTVGGNGRIAALLRHDEHNRWQATTWTTYGRAIAETAAGLDSLGIRCGDRVAILSWNRPEWQEADLGILSVGAISVPVYPTSAAPQVGYVLGHSGSKVCFVEDAEQLGGCWSSASGCPTSNTSSSSTTASRSTTRCSCRSRSCERSGPQALDRDPDSFARP